MVVAAGLGDAVGGIGVIVAAGVYSTVRLAHQTNSASELLSFTISLMVILNPKDGALMTSVVTLILSELQTWVVLLVHPRADIVCGAKRSPM